MGGTPGSSSSALSSAFSAVSNIMGGFAEQGADFARAQIARNNAIIARQNAQYAAEAGEAKTEQLGLRSRGQVAEIAARQAGSGVNPNVGSALDVRKSAGMLGALDILTARSAAARQAYGYQIEAQAQDVQSAMAKKAGNIAPWVGGFNAIGSLLGGATSLSSMYQKAQMEGLSTNSGLPLDAIFGSGGSSSGGGGGSSAADYEALLEP